MSESGPPPSSSGSPPSPTELAADLLALLHTEERYWRQAGNGPRADRFALVARIVTEEAERGAGQPTPVLRALCDFYRSSL